jgi:hypothetical protein
MSETLELEKETKRTFHRLLPRMEKELSNLISADPNGWQIFSERLQNYFPRLFKLYFSLYRMAHL